MVGEHQENETREFSEASKEGNAPMRGFILLDMGITILDKLSTMISFFFYFRK